MLKVEMVGSEMIKPASPTPPHLRLFNLTSLDLLIPPIFVHVILYYPSPGMAALSRLKASLSHCLVRFYPLAGCMAADAGRVDCNDQGVEFVESRVGSQLQELIQNPEPQALRELVPCHDYGSKSGRSESGLLAVQANFFNCGGMALGVCLCHSIGDMATFAAFFNHWSSVGSKPPACDGDRVANCLHLFPPAAGSDPALPKCVLPPLPDPAMKRFSFSDASIAALRKNLGGATRVEAVTALVCRCIARAAGKAAPPGRSEKVFIVTHSVNLRRRMEPALPDDAFGNLCATSYTAELPEEELFTSDQDGRGRLEKEVGDSIKKIDGEFARRMQGGEWSREAAIEPLLRAMKKHGREGLVHCVFSSWCRFGLYGVDFGWGRPEWVSTAPVPGRNLSILVEGRDGEGIDAWVSLDAGVMTYFQQDQQLLDSLF